MYVRGDLAVWKVVAGVDLDRRDAWFCGVVVGMCILVVLCVARILRQIARAHLLHSVPHAQATTTAAILLFRHSQTGTNEIMIYLPTGVCGNVRS